MLKKVTLSIVFGLAFGSAHAAGGCTPYYGLDVGSGKLQTNSSDELSVKELKGTLGCQFTDMLGVEARLGSAAKKFSNVFGDPNVSTGSVLGRIGYKGDRVLVYGLAGLGVANVDGADGNEAGPVLGVGLELFGTNNTALDFSYTTQPAGEFKSNGKKIDIDYGVFNIGYRYYFKDMF